MSKRNHSVMGEDLIARKKTAPAVPAMDMPTRSPAMAPARAEPVDNGEGQGREELVPLNFRLPASFRREFKTYAAQHDMKLNELLRTCFESYRRQQGE